MSPQKISAAASVGNALPLTFTPGKSSMATKPVLANQKSAKTWRVAGLANCAWHRAENQRTEDGRQKTISKFGLRIANLEIHRSQQSESIILEPCGMME